jgi:uncharacterized protein (TIGR00369 family)
LGEVNCFACGAKNPIGLHLTFVTGEGVIVNIDDASETGDGIVRASYEVEERFVGWDDVLHGGITATILDEAASYVPYSMGFVTVTARLEVRYVLPIRVGELLSIEGHFVERRRNVVKADSSIRDDQGTLRASAQAKLMILGQRGVDAVGASDFLA